MRLRFVSVCLVMFVIQRKRCYEGGEILVCKPVSQTLLKFMHTTTLCISIVTVLNVCTMLFKLPKLVTSVPPVFLEK